MKRVFFPALLLTLGVGIEPGFAFVKHGVATVAPVIVVAPTNVTLPEIVGKDVVGEMLTVRPGVWDGSASTKTYRWHMIEGATPGTAGPTLGTGTTFGPLTSAMVTACSGSTRPACGRLQVDETATNTAGNGTVISDFIGPVASSLSPPPTLGAGTPPSSLPTFPGHFLQNGHAVYPGCDIPPAEPDTSNPAKVWYFDPNPLVGKTLTAQIAAGVPTASQGHAGNPFNDPTAIFGGAKGYASLAGVTSVGAVVGTQVNIVGTSFGTFRGKVFVNGVEQGIQTWNNTLVTINLTPLPTEPGFVAPTLANTEVATGLYSRMIQPGDVMFIKGDPSGARIGYLSGGGYSTTTGTSSGSVLWTWIMADPAATIAPVLINIDLSNSAGFIFKGLNVESTALDTSTFAAPTANMVRVLGNQTTPSHDLMFENMSVTSWKGHSNDPWFPSFYPNSGGHSDGTIKTASPYMGTGTGDAQTLNVTAAAPNSTQLFLNNGMPVFNTAPTASSQPWIYVWSPGYYWQQADPTFPVAAPSNTGIPNGTRVINMQGRTNLNAKSVITTSANLPATAVLNDAYFAQDTKHLWVGNATPAWVDLGAAYMTIGPCDPVDDHDSGCPSTPTPNGTPFVGCDPLIIGNTPPGGCAPGTPPVWNGTTRAMGAFGPAYNSGEYVTITARMIIPPANWWNHVDWGFAINSFWFQGVMGSSNADPTNPNDVQGTYCISAKNNLLRDNWAHVTNTLVQNVIEYGNKLKFREEDAFRVWSSHRIIIANNYISDPSFLKGHSDMIQYALSAGNINSKFYGNVAINNEGYTATDVNNQFTSYNQPINPTDQVYTGTYYCCNIIINSANPVRTNGTYNVNVHNDVFMDVIGGSGNLLISSGSKGVINEPAYTMLANNVSNSIFRDINVPGVSVGLRQPTATGGATTCVSNSPISGQRTVTSHLTGPPVLMTLGQTYTMQGFPATPTQATGAGSVTTTCVPNSPISTQHTVTVKVAGPAAIPVGAVFTLSGFTGGAVPTGNIAYNANYTAIAGTNSTTLVGQTATNGGTCPTTPATGEGIATIDPLSINATYTTLAGTNSTTLVGQTTTGGGFCPTVIGEGTTQYRPPDCSLDANTVHHNAVISLVNWETGIAVGSSSTMCVVNNSVGNSTAGGVYPDAIAWTPFDWRSGAGTGGNPLFTDYHSIPPLPQPSPGSGVMAINSCLRNEVIVGTCAPGDVGRLNMRPNPAFVPTNPTGFTQVVGATSMPTSGAIGDRFLATATAACNPGFTICGAAFGSTTFPAGMYTRCADGTSFVAPCLAATPSGTLAAYGAVASPFNPNVSPFTPGIIGAGADLGLQMPPATHGRLPWTNPPNIGAY